MRLFVAIKTDRTVNGAVKNTASSLKLFGKGTVYTDEELYHITLAFIGESNRVGDIKSVLDGIKSKPFDISLTQLGNFGDVYYVGVKPTPPLLLLQKEITKALSEKGFDIEKRSFKPHITVARRYRSDIPPVVFVPAASQRVKSVVLMQSVGGVYKILYTKEL